MATRGRGTGRGRGAQESRTQDYPYTPLRSRYPIRSYREVVPQQLALPPSGSITRNPPLNSAVRCLRGDRQAIVVALPSQPAGHCLVYENGLEDVKPSITTGSPSIRAPCTKITYQGEGSQQLAVQPPSHLDEEGNAKPSREKSEVPRYEHALGMISATADHIPPSPSHSHNVTEFARRLKDELDDDHDEVVSAPGDDYECILRHRVEKGIADLVRAIVRKYGDITSDCKVRSPPLFSFLLERMCEVYKTLEKKKMVALTRDEVNIMRDELQLCEYHKLKVGWLLERVEEISETMSSLQEYLKLKEEAGRCAESQKSIEMQVEKQWRHIALIKKNISMSEQKMAEEEAKANICMQKASDIRAKVIPLFNQSLVHNLL